MFHCIYKLFSSISYFEMKQEGHVDNTMTKEHNWNYNTKVFKNLYQNLCPPPHHLYCWSLLPTLQIQEQLSQNLQDLFWTKECYKILLLNWWTPPLDYPLTLPSWRVLPEVSTFKICQTWSPLDATTLHMTAYSKLLDNWKLTFKN